MNKHTRSVSLIDGHTEGMTDAEIMKALNRADGLEHISVYCADNNGEDVCSIKLVDIIDLINRLQAKNKELDEKLIIQKGLIDTQKAEIERYKKNEKSIDAKCDSIQEYLVILKSEIHKDIAQAKSEAIKEFWKRFDKVLCENIGPSKRVYWKISSDGNNLVKEMTEVSE